MIAAALNALPSPDEAIFYTSGRTSNEAAFLYQLFVREFGTNNLPDCSNMCHEAIRRGAERAARQRQGLGHARGFRARPTRSSSSARTPAPTIRACSASCATAARRGCRIVVFNPLRERGLERFANPQSPADMLRRQRHADRLGVLPAAHRRRPGGGDRHWPRSWSSATRSIATSLPRIPAASTRSPRRCARPTGPTLERESGLSRAELEQAAQIYIDSQRDDPVLGHGHHPAHAQRRHDPDAGQPAAPARQHRQARRRPLPGARPLQRAGRPHDGHLRAAVAGIPRPPRRRVRLPAAARARLRHHRRDRGDARRPRQRVLRHGRQLRRGHARQRARRAGAAPLRAHRARQHQAQPLAPGARPPGADPAVPGPHRDRPAGSRSAGGHGRGLDEHGASVVGHEPAGVGAAAVGAGDRRAPRRGDAAATAARRGCGWSRTTTASAIASPASSTASRTSTRACARPVASTCTIRGASACSRPPAARRRSTCTTSRAARHGRERHCGRAASATIGCSSP